MMTTNANPDIPTRLLDFFRWVEEGRSAAEALSRIHSYIVDINREIDRLQHERAAVEALLGFIADHHLAEHDADEAVIARAAHVIHAEDRSQRILARASEIALEGKRVIEPQEVVERLEHHHEVLDVTYPTSVVGNVLARSSEFRRIARNRYEYIGCQSEAETRPREAVLVLQ